MFHIKVTHFKLRETEWEKISWNTIFWILVYGILLGSKCTRMTVFFLFSSMFHSIFIVIHQFSSYSRLSHCLWKITQLVPCDTLRSSDFQIDIFEYSSKSENKNGNLWNLFYSTWTLLKTIDVRKDPVQNLWSWGNVNKHEKDQKI